MSTFLQYTGPDGEVWRVEAGAALLADYELSASDLPEWHRVMMGAEEAWPLVRRTYAVFAVLGGFDAEAMKPADAEKIGASVGKTASAVKDLLRQAREYWRRSVASRPVVKPDTGKRIPDSRENGAGARGVEDEATLLSEYGFAGVTDAREREHLVRRLADLRRYLEQENLRSTVLSLLRNEMNLLGLDEAIAANRKLIRHLNEKSPEDLGGALSAANKELRELGQDRAKIQKSIEDTMEKLGVWETPEEMRKRESFSRSIAAVIEGVQAYYADGSRELIDGVFTEGEVEVLVKEFDARPPQYRPDLAAIVVPSAVAGLWDAQYEAPKPPRHAHRWLGKGFRIGLGEARQLDGVEVEEIDRDPED